MPGRAGGAKLFDLCRFAFLAANPDLLKEMIKADVAGGGNGSAAIGGVGERALEGMTGAMLSGVEVKAAVS